jgi:hypothetical protein
VYAHLLPPRDESKPLNYRTDGAPRGGLHSPVFGPANAPVDRGRSPGSCLRSLPRVRTGGGSSCCSPIQTMSRIVVRYSGSSIQPPLQGLRLLVAANAQGKVHELLAALFERQDEWAAQSGPGSGACVENRGAKSASTLPRAQKDALAASVDNILTSRSRRFSVALKVDSTPTFFVNGKPLPTFGAQELVDLRWRAKVQASKREEVKVVRMAASSQS